MEEAEKIRFLYFLRFFYFFVGEFRIVRTAR